MRKLDRDCAEAPECLAGYDHRTDTWKSLTGEHKQQIRACLETLQGRRCAYCEGDLDLLGQHIEHFRRKSRFQFPELTFAWSNLYWSCDCDDSCGHYKDKRAGAYDVADLLNPCLDDPDKFFRFRSDGRISLRDGLGEIDLRRAQETLRVLNLDPQWGRLRKMRAAVLVGYVSLVDDGAGLSNGELREYFEDVLLAAEAEPFSTAIRHVLTEP